MFTQKFWMDTFERVASTTAQALLGALGGDAILDKVDLNINQMATIAAVAAFASFLKCMAATKIGAANTAAMLPESTDTERG